MTTKELINSSLKDLGANGFSGVSVVAKTPLAAVEDILQHPRAISQKLLHELRRQALVEISHEDKHVRVQLSTKGIHRLQQLQVNELSVPEPHTWDGLWRVVMFDVPTKHNQRRTKFTKQLNLMNFTMLRDSVWVYPHPCFEQLDALTLHCGLQQYVTYAEISRLDTVSSARLFRRYTGLQSSVINS